jgi:hypothetical protein
MPGSIITWRSSELNHPGKPAKKACTLFITYWQVKRDRRRRGIVEVKALHAAQLNGTDA